MATSEFRAILTILAIALGSASIRLGFPLASSVKLKPFSATNFILEPETDSNISLVSSFNKGPRSAILVDFSLFNGNALFSFFNKIIDSKSDSFANSKDDVARTPFFVSSISM